MVKNSALDLTDKDNENETKFRKDAIRIVVKRLREKNDFTQSRLAVLSGISRQHISEIETKGVLISYNTERKLAKALNISREDFSQKVDKEQALSLAREKEREIQVLKAAESDKSRKYGK